MRKEGGASLPRRAPLTASLRRRVSRSGVSGRQAELSTSLAAFLLFFCPTAPTAGIMHRLTTSGDTTPLLPQDLGQSRRRRYPLLLAPRTYWMACLSFRTLQLPQSFEQGASRARLDSWS